MTRDISPAPSNTSKRVRSVSENGARAVEVARQARPDLVSKALLVYRHGDTTEEAPFYRSPNASLPYVAMIPADHVKGPSLAYAIELVQADGSRTPAFASRSEMHTVDVVADDGDAREQVLTSKIAGRRSVVGASGEYVYFGTTPATVAGPNGQTVIGNYRDAYFRVEGSFTYRFLRGVSEFGLRAGVVRGRAVVPGESDPSKFDVGLNYGAPRIRLRLHDVFHVEGEFLTSVTEVGFSVGGGGAVLVGDPYASHLTVGFEAIEVFGARGYSRVDIVANKRFTISPIVEVTNMPHASSAGVRLLGDFGVDLGAGFGATLRAGYQARAFAGGGPTAGGGLTYAF